MKPQAVQHELVSLRDAASYLGVSVENVKFLAATGVLSKQRGGVTQPSLERFAAEVARSLGRNEPLAAGVERAVIALRAEWDRALLERGPIRRAFGAVELGEHPDGTVVFAVEKALDRIVAANLRALGGGRIRQLIVDRSLMERWAAHRDLLEAIPPDVIDRVPKELAYRHRVVPVAYRDGKLVLAAGHTPVENEIDEIKLVLGLELDFVVVSPEAIAEALGRHYGAYEEARTESVSMAELSHSEIELRKKPLLVAKKAEIKAPPRTRSPAPIAWGQPPPPPSPPAGESPALVFKAAPPPAARPASVAVPPPPLLLDKEVRRDEVANEVKESFERAPGRGDAHAAADEDLLEGLDEARAASAGGADPFCVTFAAPTGAAAWANSPEPSMAHPEPPKSEEREETEALRLMAESHEGDRPLEDSRTTDWAKAVAHPVASSRGGGVASGMLRALAPQTTTAPAIATPAKPSPVPAEDEAETFERKATVRYYSQMYARRNYPLLVVVSKRSIQKIVKQHVAQVEGKKSFKIRRGNPFVTVRPILPGCLCIPAEITLDVKPKVAEAKFWVTPTAEGVLEEARVEVLYEGKVVSTIETPTRVTTQTVAKLAGSAAFLSTGAGPFFEAFGISIKKAGASFLADLLADVSGGSMRFGVAGIFAFLALVFFLRRRPKAGPETEGFFDWGVEDVVEGDPLVRATKAKLLVAGPEGIDVVDLVHASTLVGGAPTAHVRVRGARSLADVACELRFEDTFFLRARSSGVRLEGEDLKDGEERKAGRDAVFELDSGRVALWLLDVRQDSALDARRDEIFEGLVRARPSFERELRAIWKRTASEPARAAVLEAMRGGFCDPHGWQRVRAAL